MILPLECSNEHARPFTTKDERRNRFRFRLSVVLHGHSTVDQCL